MATKAELQAQIDSYNKQVNTLKNDLQNLLDSKEDLKQAVQNWNASGFNDFMNCGYQSTLSTADLDSGTTGHVSDSSCHRDFPLGRCSKDGCISRVKTVNTAIDNLNSNIAAINAKNIEINRLLGLITGLNAQVLALPESQGQIQSAVATATQLADAEKKKWIIFGIIVLVIVAAAIFIFLRFNK